MSNVVVVFCTPNVPAPAPGGPGAVGMSKVFLDGRKEGAVCAGVGAGFVCGGCTGVGVCRRDGARCCEAGTGVELGLGDNEGVVASAGAGVGAAGGGGCDMARAGKGGNVESGTDKLGACVTIGYEEAVVEAASGTGEGGGGGANGEGG